MIHVPSNSKFKILHFIYYSTYFKYNCLQYFYDSSIAQTIKIYSHSIAICTFSGGDRIL